MLRNSLNFICFLVVLTVLPTGCAPGKLEIKDKSVEALRELWVKGNIFSSRFKIVQELERRKETGSLIYFLSLPRSSGYPPSHKDTLTIIQSLGRLKDPKALWKLHMLAYGPNKEITLSVLEACKAINDPSSVRPTIRLLNDPDEDIRWAALDTLAQLRDPESVEKVYPILFDPDPQIRWKAIHTLGKIGDPRAIDRISLLLADDDETVRSSAKSILKTLGVPDDKIKEWETKAKQLSLDDLYGSKVAYQKAILEKKELLKKLESEADIKRQLEGTLGERNSALKRQERLIDSLYEKERQLKSKVYQLEIARNQSEGYQKELETLRVKSDGKNKELEEAKSEILKGKIEKELEQLHEKKLKVEADAERAQSKEARLRDEISYLSSVIEKAHQDSEETRKELETARLREKELLSQVDKLKERLTRGMAPVVVISQPKDGSKTDSPNTVLNTFVVDDKGIEELRVYLNGKLLEPDSKRGLKVVPLAAGSSSRKLHLTQRLQLEYGENTIRVSARDIDGMSVEEVISVVREREHGKIWAIVIGLNQYQDIRNLKYAVNDARAFRNYLIEYMSIPEEQIFFLTDQGATKLEIESLLATKIKRTAGKDDTVIIFYAGHGAAETDPVDPDGDGFEKYLLPYDARLDDLYSTAISMKDIKIIFQRIQADRLIFIADTCYSGASGGRTMLTSQMRATLTETFFERISRGKGRVIISACSANEISKEDDKLKHGIFTYYLLEGLRGESDHDGDGIITVSELFSYLSHKVPNASGQDQHPVRKGEIQGELVIGRVK